MLLVRMTNASMMSGRMMKIARNNSRTPTPNWTPKSAKVRFMLSANAYRRTRMMAVNSMSSNPSMTRADGALFCDVSAAESPPNRMPMTSRSAAAAKPTRMRPRGDPSACAARARTQAVRSSEPISNTIMMSRLASVFSVRLQLHCHMGLDGARVEDSVSPSPTRTAVAAEARRRFSPRQEPPDIKRHAVDHSRRGFRRRAAAGYYTYRALRQGITRSSESSPTSYLTVGVAFRQPSIQRGARVSISSEKNGEQARRVHGMPARSACNLLQLIVRSTVAQTKSGLLH